jgi:Uncharacterised nucleotidyltransferase
MAQPPALRHEFLLAAACCLWPPSERRNEAIRDAVIQTLDWDRFLRVVNRHRVAGLIHDGLAQAGVSAPPGIASQIHDMKSRIARQNLQYAAECWRIQQLFDEADVPLLFVKGVTLAQLAYGSLALKHSWDIDLLVMPNTVPKALRLLERAGYHAFPPLPPITDERYMRWIRFAREYVLFHETNAVHIEIHWKLADNNYFFPGISAISPTQMVTISQRVQLRTLNHDDLFTYLCVHGAGHGWSRLKWLADVAALMAHDSVSDAEHRLEYAKTVNADHSVAQSFLLCDRLFGTPSLVTISQKLRRSYRYRWLEHTALQAMTNGNAETELGNASFDLFPILLSHFLLGRGIRFLVNELWNKLNRPYDQHYLTLPNWLGFLYSSVRVVTWVNRRGRMRPLPVPPKQPKNNLMSDS